MTVNKERLALGIAELRNPERKQGTGRLRDDLVDGTSEFCCLGILTEVAIENGLELTWNNTKGWYEWTNEFGGQCEQSVLPKPVMEWYGLTDDNPDLDLNDGNEGSGGDTAIGANDDLNLTFPEIADAFERTYLKDEDA